MSSAFRLDDPRVTQANAPYTFFLLSARDVRRVSAGDLVKLIFLPTELDGPVGAERMWVQVKRRDGDALEGKLDNIPSELKSLSLGDIIAFNPWHIISIDFATGEPAPLANQRDIFFERCLVDACVLDGSKQVHFVYREAADMEVDGDRHPDSGWRVRGDWRNTTDAELDAREVRYVALGAVLNKDDSWVHLLDKPEGVRYMRDWDTDTFVPEED